MASATQSSEWERLDSLLDEGLKNTFPASDPVAVHIESHSATRNAGPVAEAKQSREHRGQPMAQRLDYWKTAPKGLAAYWHFNDYAENCGLERSLLELVRMRASQINGCAYCLDMHSKDARAAGETEQRLYTLSAWRETPFFSGREQAALAWTEALTLISEGPVEDELYDDVSAYFSEEELVDLTLAVVAINGWNRLAIPFRMPAGSYQPREGGSIGGAASATKPDRRRTAK